MRLISVLKFRMRRVNILCLVRCPYRLYGLLKNLCDKRGDLDFDEFWNKDSKTDLYHFIGKDIVYFHSLFWPTMLEGSQYRKPTNLFVHGYVTVNGAKCPNRAEHLLLRVRI